MTTTRHAMTEAFRTAQAMADQSIEESDPHSEFGRDRLALAGVKVTLDQARWGDGDAEIILEFGLETLEPQTFGSEVKADQAVYPGWGTFRVSIHAPSRDLEASKYLPLWRKAQRKLAGCLQRLAWAEDGIRRLHSSTDV